jgi:hypothetical protein
MRTITVNRCPDCGAISVPWFGFYAPCRASRHGGHVRREKIEISITRAARMLREAYYDVPHYDRENFDRNAPREIKSLLEI